MHSIDGGKSEFKILFLEEFHPSRVKSGYFFNEKINPTQDYLKLFIALAQQMKLIQIFASQSFEICSTMHPNL